VPFASPAPVVSIASTAGIALLDVQSALRRLDRDGLVELSPQGWRLTPAARE
jgi:DNA-binding GntR family transcriptional regulator